MDTTTLFPLLSMSMSQKIPTFNSCSLLLNLLLHVAAIMLSAILLDPYSSPFSYLIDLLFPCLFILRLVLCAQQSNCYKQYTELIVNSQSSFYSSWSRTRGFLLIWKQSMKNGLNMQPRWVGIGMWYQISYGRSRKWSQDRCEMKEQISSLQEDL